MDSKMGKAIKMSKTKLASHYIGSEPTEGLGECLHICMFMCIYLSRRKRDANILCERLKSGCRMVSHSVSVIWYSFSHQIMCF